MKRVLLVTVTAFFLSSHCSNNIFDPRNADSDLAGSLTSPDINSGSNEISFENQKMQETISRDIKNFGNSVSKKLAEVKSTLDHIIHVAAKRTEQQTADIVSKNTPQSQPSTQTRNLPKNEPVLSSSPDQTTSNNVTSSENKTDSTNLTSTFCNISATQALHIATSGGAAVLGAIACYKLTEFTLEEIKSSVNPKTALALKTTASGLGAIAAAALAYKTYDYIASF